VAFHKAFAASAAVAVGAADDAAVVEEAAGLLLLLLHPLAAEVAVEAAVALTRLDFPFEVESQEWNPLHLAPVILSD
jgi:hypothetical protein